LARVALDVLALHYDRNCWLTKEKPMTSPEAQKEIERLFAERQDRNKPLAQRRREWEAEAEGHVLVEGARFASVIAGGIAAEWVDVPGAEPGRIVLLLHGGGYNAGSPKTHRKMAADLGAAARARVLVPDYRLAPEHPFPAAVKDALLAYGWLLSQGHTPENIILAGDSAGGGLALSMLLALREAKAVMPRAGVLMAPWTDLTCSSPSYEDKRALDPIITKEYLAEAGTWYAGRRDPRDPMASPLFADLSGLPPLLIHAGGDETMVDDSRLFVERAKEAGVAVVYKEWPGLWHVFHHAAPGVPEAAQAYTEIADFISRL
jgi:acetyl esterase/lipase